jgi:DNA-binding cell septation regulator SpoVG
MEIRVRVNPLSNPTGPVVAMGDVTLVTDDGELILKGWKVVNGKNGLFAGAPSAKRGEAYEDTIIAPKESGQFLLDIKQALVDEYESQTGGSTRSSSSAAKPAAGKPATKSSVPDSYLAKKTAPAKAAPKASTSDEWETD